MKLSRILLAAAISWSLAGTSVAQPTSAHDLHFNKLANVWDEAIPLGNGMVGALIWQKDDKLRFSLDRADIWDMRPMEGLHREEFSYKWVQGQVAKKDYKPVQDYFDAPYDREPAPSKIPGGALEFVTKDLGSVTDVRLNIAGAESSITWSGGAKLTTFVHATKPVGWFKFDGVSSDIVTDLIAPKYQGAVDQKEEVNSLVGNDLARLGYKQGKVVKTQNRIVYQQEGWGGFTYEIAVSWKKTGSSVTGVWSVTSHYPGQPAKQVATSEIASATTRGFGADRASHYAWWKNFWAASSLRVPDPLLEKQWYLEQYKFGSSARRGAPPISLQAVWTADNGKIPPWKGDYHHDLNTQLSYWPAYSGNHLGEALGYLDHLDENKKAYEKYTRRYFGANGIAVPGVTTLDGTEMGGWIQYSLSPTVSSWLAQHYYLQWKYSMDKTFLRDRGYPWVRSVCRFVEEIAPVASNGKRKLPISSSPEINDNKITAWFPDNTNYDLALMKYALTIGAEMATALGKTADAEHWKKVLSEFGDYALTDNQEMMFSPTMAYNQSHRHFSHLMAIHPLGLIKWEDGEKSQTIIKNTIAQLDKTGPDWWCGYSYAWLGNLKARAKDGEGAAKALSIFAKAFCLPNSFHANGDQTKTGLSKMTYRPFTLEGNFAFAAGLQEMLLQSYAGFIEIMPAIPADWKNVSFEKMRTEGAFLISASRTNGQLDKITVTAENGGEALLKLASEQWKVAQGSMKPAAKNGLLSLQMKPGQSVTLVLR